VFGDQWAFTARARPPRSPREIRLRAASAASRTRRIDAPAPRSAFVSGWKPPFNEDAGGEVGLPDIARHV